MLPAAMEFLLGLPDEARVLDVGGWAAPLNRADWVIDLMPYESRGAMFAGVGPPPARFGPETWVVADICGQRPWPFEAGFFDFAVCTYTLEDVRDPIRVCEEMSRVAQAGYIEVPSMLDELTWRNPEASGGPWAGHQHHRWLCSLERDELVFLSKFHSLNTNQALQVPPRWARRLEEHERVLDHFWQDKLPARERMAIESYPFDELARTIEQRFRPSRTQVRARDLTRRARSAGMRLLTGLGGRGSV